MNKELTADLNYKDEYNRLMDSHKLLCGEYADLKKKYEELRDEFGRLKAQMDIVYLIFGNRC